MWQGDARDIHRAVSHLVVDVADAERSAENVDVSRPGLSSTQSYGVLVHLYWNFAPYL